MPKFDRKEFTKTCEMAKTLPCIPFTDTVSPGPEGNICFHVGHIRECQGRGLNLFNAPQVGVLRGELNANMHLPMHFHEVNEWIIVYEGALEMHVAGEVVRLTVGQGTYIPAGTKHDLRAPVKTKVIAVTVPCEPGFPTGGQQNG